MCKQVIERALLAQRASSSASPPKLVTLTGTGGSRSTPSCEESYVTAFNHANHAYMPHDHAPLTLMRLLTHRLWVSPLLG